MPGSGLGAGDSEVKKAGTCVCGDGSLGEETDDKRAKQTNVCVCACVCRIINCGKG